MKSNIGITRHYIFGLRCIVGALAVIAIVTMAIYCHAVNTDNGIGYRSSAADRMVAAYVRSTRDSLPDPSLMTHIYYAFGVFTDAKGNITIENPERFDRILALREKNPDLKIVLSVGGGPREGFSEMASSSKNRRRFAMNCRRLADRYDLAGIDLDWEFPTTTRGGHTAADNDMTNYGKVMRELRRQLGSDRQLSFYSNNGAAYIDYQVMLPYVDYVMVSGYNLGRPPKHQSNLYPSDKCGEWSVSASIERHIAKGVPTSKILLGVSFYALRDGEAPNEIDRTRFQRYLPGLTEVWDDEAKVPYLADSTGNMIASFDNVRSLREKCNFIRKNGLAGVFYWHYDNDDARHSMARALNDEFMSSAKNDSVISQQ